LTARDVWDMLGIGWTPPGAGRTLFFKPSDVGVDKMDDGKPRELKLTRKQRELVEHNIGLVGVHLRRGVPNLQQPRRDREWDDLFQEGCLGLMRAASSYDPARGIPFAAYALARIHTAVYRALGRKFSTVVVPPKRARAGGDCPGGRTSDGDRPKVHLLPEDAANCLRDTRDHDSVDGSRETIGDRLRAKYERAVHLAAHTVARATSTRGDRRELVRILTEERFLIPSEEARRALRQIARDTRSSYARVAMCDKQLAQGVRAALRADPEFCELQRQRATNPEGAKRILDDALEGELAGKSKDEFLARLRGADPGQRAKMVDALLQVSQDDISELAQRRFAHLSPLAREQLLRQCPDNPPESHHGSDGPSHRRRRNNPRASSRRERGRAQAGP